VASFAPFSHAAMWRRPRGDRFETHDASGNGFIPGTGATMS
jgi:hypothetical protein